MTLLLIRLKLIFVWYQCRYDMRHWHNLWTYSKSHLVLQRFNNLMEIGSIADSAKYQRLSLSPRSNLRSDLNLYTHTHSTSSLSGYRSMSSKCQTALALSSEQPLQGANKRCASHDESAKWLLGFNNSSKRCSFSYDVRNHLIYSRTTRKTWFIPTITELKDILIGECTGHCKS